MRRTITTKAGTTLVLECSAASTIIFKRLWGENLMAGFQNIKHENTDDLLEFMEKVVFTFAKTAELGAKNALRMENREDEFIDFLSNFEFLELATGGILDTVTEMWGLNTKTESTPKNQSSPQQENPL